MKIYTKTGDKGVTSLIGGTRVPKSDLRIEAYGTVDELNSHVGLCRDLVTEEAARSILLEVQDRLFTIGSSLACDPEREPRMRLPDIREEDMSLLEREMDRMSEAIPPLRSFVLPGGHPTVSHIHIARCVCRRAERCVVRLDEVIGSETLMVKYLNRLSDYLFILSRYACHLLGVEEQPWRPRI